MKKNHLIKILSSLIVKFSASQELIQVKFINCYLKKYISFTTKSDIRDLGPVYQTICKGLMKFSMFECNELVENCFPLFCYAPIGK